MKKRLSIILMFFLYAAAMAFAQTTKVRGRVLDASDGSPVPFAGVFFKDSDVGVSADIEGCFSLSTRDLSLVTLKIQMLGYAVQDVNVKPGSFNALDIFLVPQKNTIDAATVKADNEKARRLLANIDAHRDRNNPEKRPAYSCDVYSRMELDLTHPQEQLKSKAVRQQWGFIFEYVDTSDISGVPYLPVLINETVSRRLHSRDPDIDRENILANKLSGAEPDGNLLAQFTGSIHLRNNFYKPFINAFNVEIPSPINEAGLLFYNYFIIDSLLIGGRKTLMVRYHPKPAISTPAFDGEMMVDAEDFALKSIKARMVRGQNINWVRDMVIETSYTRLPDSTWFYDSERFYADFSVSTRTDSSKLISFIGNRNLRFSNPVFDKEKIDASTNLVVVEKGATDKSDKYWESVRPYELTSKEKNIYSMVDEVQGTNLYKGLYNVIYTIINGYWEFDKVGIGPYHKIVSFNPLEGFRLGFGARTSVKWSNRDRIAVFGAYGFKDKEFKGGLTWEHLFSKEPTSKLTVDAHYDVLQLGKGLNKYTTGNLLSSIMGSGASEKPSPVAEGSILYDHEFTGNLNAQFELMYRQFFANSFVPLVTPEGNWVRNMPTATARVSLRLSHDETVTRGHFIKTFTHTDYPVVTLDMNAGAAFLDSSTYPFFRPEISLDWKYRIPPVGMSRLHVNLGTVVGQVPYTMLHLHEGNGTIMMDKTSFSCMDFMEFASDTWVTVMLDHNFYGFFLGKIPFIKELQWREALVVKASWGYLSPGNNGIRSETSTGGMTQVTGCRAPVCFPEGVHAMGNIPYVEAGFAITNILRLFRVDFIWRLTHRDDPRPKPRNFTVNLGLELKF